MVFSVKAIDIKKMEKEENRSPSNQLRVVSVENYRQGIEYAKQKLYELVDPSTILFLSGGTTPKPLYEELAKEGQLQPGGAALVDERYGGGRRYHENSNEKMIKETGLLDFFASKDIPFYPILLGGRNKMKQLSQAYNIAVHAMFSHYQKSVGILGIGKDGHTASLPAGVRSSKFPTSPRQMTRLRGASKVKSYVTEIDNFPGEFRQRITLTFKALSKMDLLIVLVFGSKKKNALKLMFTQGLEEEVPARFFNRPDISKKTIVITDQRM